MTNNELIKHFDFFRNNIIGIDTVYHSPYGEKRIIYADWIASGRLYLPIEDKIKNIFGPYVANTHTGSSETGSRMTMAYQTAHQIIKKHVNAGTEDVIITAGFGMTAVVNKLQRILGLKICGKINRKECIATKERPVVFLTHMEHHSNQTSWYETNADVEIINPDVNLMVDLDDLQQKLEKHKNRRFKIGSFTACSNVTGVFSPVHSLAKIMHKYKGLCFIDYAASAPYKKIDMHPADPDEKLDGIFFSPHKFLGGPGSSGVLIFDKKIYNQTVPDNPGGGTVDWTNPWGGYKYVDDIEIREDGGTPGFIQSIRTALATDLKNKMGVENIEIREKQQIKKMISGLRAIKGIHILAGEIEDRIGAISFYHTDIHYNLIVKLLSDKYGIQVRGGCVCAGTYGHFLLNVDKSQSKRITDKINKGDLSEKPGWVRLSIHPTNNDQEIEIILDSIKTIVKNHELWKKDYSYSQKTNEFNHKRYKSDFKENISDWFSL
jgi:selenocysteine lyase/cysteine desulfurase